MFLSFVVYVVFFLLFGYFVFLDLNLIFLLFNEDYILFYELRLEDKVFDVIVLFDYMFVVIIGVVKRVELIDVKDEMLQLNGKIELDIECFYVFCIDDKIVIGNGSFVSFFNVKGVCLKIIIMFGMIQFLYILKFYWKMYFNIWLEYVFCVDMCGNWEYKYKYDDLQEIGGVIVDNRLLVYVCGFKFNNVYQIGFDGWLV